MVHEPTVVEKLRGLNWSVACNAAGSVFNQFTYFGSAFVLFLNLLGLSKTEIGFTLALIPFSAIIAPFVAPMAARYGYKRVFVIFYALRKATTILLLFTPWVLAQFGARAVFFYVAGVVATFATVRSVEETAYYPWVQEFVPNSVRGKYSATSNIFTALAGFASVLIASAVIEWYSGLTGFMILFAAGGVAGFVSVWASTHIPGGAPVPKREDGHQRRDLWDALADKDFRLYLIGIALVTLGTVPLASFLPLYLEEMVGLSTGNVVAMQLGTLLGALVSSYVWGWAADRYGSKPVMLTGASLLVLIPLLWWVIPRQSSMSLYWALLVAFLQGVANLGWGIGAGRLLFVSIVPTAKKLDYMALYFAWIGVISGLSQFVGGSVLDFARGLEGTWGGLTVDQYTPVFVSAILLSGLGMGLFRWLRGDNVFSTAEFAGMFLRGNPLLAMGSLIRFYRAKDEHDAVIVTERLGSSKSKLTVDELLDALADPRFNVRFEAILAIARMPADERLTKALVRVLESRSPALSVIAAWALGRIGDKQARLALRAGLDNPYRSVRAHSARALATLDDTEIVPVLLERLEAETDEGLRIAYASALGKLRAIDAMRTLLTLLRDNQDESNRMELALAVARMVGAERRFIALLRQWRSQPGTAAAHAMDGIRKLFARHSPNSAAAECCTRCAEYFARDELEEGVRELCQCIRLLRLDAYLPSSVDLLHECMLRMERYGARRPEYVLLALHTLLVGGVGEKSVRLKQKALLH